MTKPLPLDEERRRCEVINDYWAKRGVKVNARPRVMAITFKGENVTGIVSDLTGKERDLPLAMIRVPAKGWPALSAANPRANKVFDSGRS